MLSVENPHQVLKDLPESVRAEVEYKGGDWKVSLFPGRYQFPTCSASSADFSTAVAVVLEDMMKACKGREAIIKKNLDDLEMMVEWLSQYQDVVVDLDKMHAHVEKVTSMIQDLDQDPAD